jgi:hypothetical protein
VGRLLIACGHGKRSFLMDVIATDGAPYQLARIQLEVLGDVERTALAN